METIDADWIRARLTGRRGEQAELARALGIDDHKLTKILNGQRRVQGAEVPRLLAYFDARPPGLAEPAAAYAPFATPARPTERLRLIASLVAPGVAAPTYYTVARAAPAAGLLPGDTLILELGATGRPGDHVLVTAPTAGGDYTTNLYRYLPPLFVAVDPLAPDPAVPADADDVSMMAAVRGVIRLPPDPAR